MTVFQIAYLRFYAAYMAWNFSFYCPHGEDDCNDVVDDVERKARLLAYSRRVYNIAVDQWNSGEHAEAWKDEENMDWMARVLVEGMGLIPAS